MQELPTYSVAGECWDQGPWDKLCKVPHLMGEGVGDVLSLRSALMVVCGSLVPNPFQEHPSLLCQ